jgi:alpha-galactosidase
VTGTVRAGRLFACRNGHHGLRTLPRNDTMESEKRPEAEKARRTNEEEPWHKVAFIGAGGVGFTRTLLRHPERPNCGTSRCRHDISQKNLDMVTALCQRDIDSNGLDIRSTPRPTVAKRCKGELCDQRGPGRRTRRVQAGYRHSAALRSRPVRGRHLCAGGIMYGQRGVPVMLTSAGTSVKSRPRAAGCSNYSNPTR